MLYIELLQIEMDWRNVTRVISAGLIIITNKFLIEIMCLTAIALTIYIEKKDRIGSKLKVYKGER